MSVLTVCLLVQKPKKKETQTQTKCRLMLVPVHAAAGGVGPEGAGAPGTAGPRSHSLCLTSIRRIEVSLFTQAAASAASVTA